MCRDDRNQIAAELRCAAADEPGHVSGRGILRDMSKKEVQEQECRIVLLEEWDADVLQRLHVG